MGRGLGSHDGLARIAAAAIAVSAGCRDARSAAVTIAWGDTVVLADSDTSISVIPFARLDRDGGFLVADLRESQIRVYDAAGTLSAQFGERGAGPEEFTAPRVAARLRDGSVLAADFHSKLVLLSGDGLSLERILAVDRGRIEDAEVINDTIVVLAAELRGPASPRLHLLNLRSDSIITSFFNPLVGTAVPTAASALGWVFVDVHGEALVATYGVSDTLYFFEGAGSVVRRTPIPFRGYRAPVEMRPEDNVSREARNDWLRSFDLIGEVHWVRDDLLLVEVISWTAAGQDRHLVALNPSGELVFELRRSPQLLDAQGNQLLFRHPDPELVNRLIRGEIQ